MTHTINVPPALDMIPALDVDPAAILDFAGDLLASAVTLDDLDTFTHAESSSTEWAGDAGDAYRQHISVVGADSQAIAEAFRQVARSADDHAEALASLLTRREELVASRELIEDRRLVLIADLGRLSAVDVDATDLESRTKASRADRSGIVSGVEALNADLAKAEEEINSAFARWGSVAEAISNMGTGPDLGDVVLDRPGSPTSGASPAEVAAWWAALSEEEQFAVMSAHPELIGNTDGLPVAMRDRANRMLLEMDLEAFRLRAESGDLRPGDADVLANMEAAYLALASATGYRDPVTGDELVAFLHLYDPHAFGGDGKVAITLGDAETADNVSILVPGIGNSGATIGSNLISAYAIYSEARSQDPNASMASVIWIGYDSPDGWGCGSTLRETNATRGGAYLADYVDGLNASRRAGDAHITVIGHSYGSTTTAHGASDRGLEVDDIVLVGSPRAGGGVGHASQLGVGEDHVWAGNNSRDLVAALADNGWVGGGALGGAGLGNDVGEDDFGAQRFRAESVTRNEHVRNFSDHTKYFGERTESLSNIGSIVVGDYDAVTRADPTYDPWWGPVQDPEWDREPAP
ncbi:alpha/beta hydrolase [Cellulomonas sp. NPDC089187]|uniref:alpha/beta hydrolase n=1 Tax=Cellulomonas sp. NPDC089187 TaxID=3154970 RepID=UPI003424B145